MTRSSCQCDVRQGEAVRPRPYSGGVTGKSGFGDRDLLDDHGAARRATETARRVLLVEAEDLLHDVESVGDLAEGDVGAARRTTPPVEGGGLGAGHEEEL